MNLGLSVLAMSLAFSSTGLWAQSGPPPDSVEVLSISHGEAKPLTRDDTIRISARYELPNLHLRRGEFGVYIASAHATKRGGFIVPRATTSGAEVFVDSGVVELSVTVEELIVLGASTDPLNVWIGLAVREAEYYPQPADSQPSTLPLASSRSLSWTVVE